MGTCLEIEEAVFSGLDSTIYRRDDMEKMQKCWEFKKCGREVTRDCNAIIKNADNFCWMFAGTMCDGVPQGTFVEKFGSCKQCDFYLYVHKFKKNQ